MTEIEVFDYFGEPLGTETQQLTLAYAFGDGREESCELTAEALSKLLFGLKIDGYFAVNMDSISYFNDAVGGVPVTVDDEMVANQYPEDFKMGETVNLTGDLTEKYVRFRDVDEDWVRKYSSSPAERIPESVYSEGKGKSGGRQNHHNPAGGWNTEIGDHQHGEGPVHGHGTGAFEQSGCHGRR